MKYMNISQLKQISLKSIEMLSNLFIRICNHVMLPKFILIRADVIFPICIIALIVAWKVDKKNLLKKRLRNEKDTNLDNVEENKIIS